MNIITKDLLLAASEVCTTPIILVCFHRMPKVNVEMRFHIWIIPIPSQSIDRDLYRNAILFN